MKSIPEIGRETKPLAIHLYKDRRAASKFANEEAYRAFQQKHLDASRTVYVGNLSFMVEEEPIRRHFSQCGNVTRIFMGLHSVERKCCGFCFVEFSTRESALIACNYLKTSILDDQVINVAPDVGRVREDARFWGRGYFGGQVRDHVRHDVNLSRGGVGLRDAAALGTHTSTTALSGSKILVYSWEPRNWGYVAANDTKNASNKQNKSKNTNDNNNNKMTPAIRQRN